MAGRRGEIVTAGVALLATAVVCVAVVSLGGGERREALLSLARRARGDAVPSLGGGSAGVRSTQERRLRAQQMREKVQSLAAAAAKGEPEVGTPFHMTKFGPIRSGQWQSNRYRVLALWEAASRSLESCMDAENFIFPHAKDSSCTDVRRAFDGVRECMTHQHDGLRGLADGRHGAWEALSGIVDETKELGEEDREMVARKITGDAALYTLARLDAMHSKCAGEGFANPSSRRLAPLMSAPHDPVWQAERAVGYVRGQEGEFRGDPAGRWPIRVDVPLAEDDGPAYGLKRDGWDSIRRASRRGYLDRAKERPEE